MAKVITQYAATDGTKFDSELLADAHDTALSQKVSVAAYVVAAGLTKADATRAVRHISGYTTFMTTFGVPQAASNDGAAQAA